MLTTQPAQMTSADFETIYADARGDSSQIPWADVRPHPALVTWLNAVAPSLVRCGARVAVVGCGLGEDAREIMRRGYDVTAFDCSETAVQWAKRLDRSCADIFHVADIFDLPGRWTHRFDLVVEINTVQALPPDRRHETVDAISTLLSPRGMLLMICRASETPVPVDDGPPWAVTEHELGDAATAAGLEPAAPVSVFLDAKTPPVRRMRALFKRRGA
jgi:SAM-dependent methyltransferase